MPLNRPTQTDLLQAVAEYLRIPVTELGDQKADQFLLRFWGMNRMELTSTVVFAFLLETNIY